MRNAAAKFDDDFAYEASARRARPGRPRGVSPRKRAGARPKKDKSRYLRYAAIGLSAALTVGIMVNALALQQSRHPAPFFTKPIPLAEDTPAALVPSPPPAQAQTPAPAPRAAISAPAKSIEQTGSISALLAASSRSVAPRRLAIPVQRPRHTVSEAPKARSDDAIGKLLKTPNATPNEAAREHVKEPPKTEPKTVLATQHALMKLGFVIKPNGTFGPATHAAIEAFERDQNMPVKGEMSPKLLKQLSAESGVAID